MSILPHGVLAASKKNIGFGSKARSQAVHARDEADISSRAVLRQHLDIHVGLAKVEDAIVARSWVKEAEGPVWLVRVVARAERPRVGDDHWGREPKGFTRLVEVILAHEVVGADVQSRHAEPGRRAVRAPVGGFCVLRGDGGAEADWE